MADNLSVNITADATQMRAQLALAQADLRAYILLDPMDIIELNDAALGYSQKWVRITEITENADNTLTIQAEEYLLGTGGAPSHTMQVGSGFSAAVNADPTAPFSTVIWEPSFTLAGDLEIWIAASGQADFGGAEVYASTVNSSYSLIDEITGPSRIGDLTASLAPVSPAGSGLTIDNTNTLSVDMSPSGQMLIAGTHADAEAANTLCFVASASGPGEYLAYSGATLGSGQTYALTYLNRGLYERTPVSHALGTSFVRLIPGTFLRWSLTLERIGTTFHFKVLPFNPYGGGQLGLAEVTAVSYAVVGSAFANVSAGTVAFRNNTGTGWLPIGTFNPSTTIFTAPVATNVAAVGVTGTLTAAQIGSVNATSITGTILAGQIGSVSASTITGTVTASLIGSVNASVIAGTVTASQINTVTAGQITGTLTSGQIGSVAAATVTGTLSAGQIGALNAGVITGGISAGQITSLTAGQITGTLTASQIGSVGAASVTGTLTAGQIGSIGAVQISAVNASSIVGSIAASQITSLDMSQLTGSISSSQITSITAAQVTGTLTSSQIASVAASTIIGTLSAGQIGSVNASAISGGLTAGQITSVVATSLTGTVTTSQIGTLQVTGAQIAGGAINASKFTIGGASIFPDPYVDGPDYWIYPNPATGWYIDHNSGSGSLAALGLRGALTIWSGAFTEAGYNEVITKVGALAAMVVEQPGVGMHSYAVECKLGDATDFTAATLASPGACRDPVPQMTRIFYLYPGPDGFVRGWGQADGETDADIAAILSVPGRVHVDAAIIVRCKAGGTWGWNGVALVAMALPVNIERERAAALWQADQTAEAQRRPFLSAGAGQALEYVLTLLEAQQALAAATTVAGDFPLLAAELQAQTEAGGNPTLLDVARQIVAVDKSTRIALAAIKLRRRRAKIVIRAAADVGAMQSALTGAAQTA